MKLQEHNMTKHTLVIASRESPLALKQTGIVKEALEKIHPNLAIKILGMTTTGDKILGTALNKVGGKGLFVKELERALASGDADIAVHSMKDVPMELTEIFALPVICERDDPRDVFVSNRFQSLAELPIGAVLGTASLRRQSQILALRPDLTIKLLRGNINTRLGKLDAGEYDAIVLAAAGLKRMGFNERIRDYLSTETCLPAAGQGALGIEIRANDSKTLQLIKPLNDERANACITAERAVCRYLNGGCSVPIAAYAEMHDEMLHLRALIANPRGDTIIRAEMNGHKSEADPLGIAVAEHLIQQGAKAILQQFNHD